MMYTVGEIAKKLNVTASTLRDYDKEGLLPFVKRSDGGMRIFGDEDMSSLKVIECLKKTGMPIKEIKHFMDCCLAGDDKIGERLAIVKSQRDQVLRQMEEQQNMLEMLNYKCWYYETAEKAGSCAVHDLIRIEDIPTEFRKFRCDLEEETEEKKTCDL